MLRRTKIVATLGPATSSAESLQGIINAGVDVVRLNFSHGSAEDHIAMAALIREQAKNCGRIIAVLADLQGPKLRIARFKDGKVTLKVGQPFALDASFDKHMGDETQVGLDYEDWSKTSSRRYSGAGRRPHRNKGHQRERFENRNHRAGRWQAVE
jgi:pyruvate kinase